LLLVPGVGARTVRALAMVAEIVHGAPDRFADPARFSFAHGGKDRHPFPAPLRIYGETIKVLQKAKLGRTEALAAVKRLDNEARRVQRLARGPPVEEIVAEERRLWRSFAGRDVFGREAAPESSPDAERSSRNEEL
jgi:uncharacterized protein